MDRGVRDSFKQRATQPPSHLAPVRGGGGEAQQLLACAQTTDEVFGHDKLNAGIENSIESTVNGIDRDDFSVPNIHLH